MRYRKIDPRIWRDEKFRELSSEDKLIAFYILTAQSNRVGLFYFSVGMAAEELGYVPATFGKRIKNVCDRLKWGFDEGSKTVWIPNWWRYNRPENPNVMTGALEDLHEVPETPLLDLFWANKTGLFGSVLDVFEDQSRNVTETFTKGSLDVCLTYAKSVAVAVAVTGAETGTRETAPLPPSGGSDASRSPVVIPSNLNTQRFSKAWTQWQAFRREQRKPLKPMTENAQIKKLSAWGEAAAVESIEQSIGNGWTGLFEPKNSKSIRKPKENFRDKGIIKRSPEEEAQYMIDLEEALPGPPPEDPDMELPF